MAVRDESSVRGARPPATGIMRCCRLLAARRELSGEPGRTVNWPTEPEGEGVDSELLVAS